jgi:hypothetical protein
MRGGQPTKACTLGPLVADQGEAHVGIWRIMKRVLAISNLIAASLLTLFLLLPLVLVHVVKPIGDSGEEGIIIGGTDGPTAIFLSSEPSILALTFVILMAGLLFWNAHTMWKER